MKVKINTLDDMAKYFGVKREQVERGAKYARCEGLSDEEICMAASVNYLSLSAVPKNYFWNSLVSACRAYSQMLPRFKNQNKVSGNSVRDRLLEVGVYNPNHPDYVDKTLKGLV